MDARNALQGLRCGRAGRPAGFSLVELMVAVAIIGILSAIAIPSFREYQRTSYRAAAKAVLLEAASRQEQFVMQNRGYVTGVPSNNFSQLGMTIPEEALRAYDFTITAPATSATDPDLEDMPTFLVTATPKGAWAGELPTLTVNQFGLRMPRSAW